MIYDHLSNAARYETLGTGFAASLAFLIQATQRAPVPGRNDILHPGICWATTVRVPGRRKADSPLEYHRRYADIHLCLEGTEQIGWNRTLRACGESLPFDRERDFGLLPGGPEEYLVLPPGYFAIFFPGEPHAPLISEELIAKITVKVLASTLPALNPAA